MDVLDSVLELWELTNPEIAYQSGLCGAAGRFFVRSEESLERVRRAASGIASALDEVLDEDLRATALSLVRSIRSKVEDVRPYDVIGMAANGLYVLLTKGEDGDQVVINYLRQMGEALSIDAPRWEGARLSAECKKHLHDKYFYLTKMFEALRKKGTPSTSHELFEAIEGLSPLLSPYSDMYRGAGIETGDKDELIESFKRYETAPEALRGYGDLLRDRYGFPWGADEMRDMALSWLDEELPRLDTLVEKFASHYGVVADFESVYEEMSARNKVEQDVVALAVEIDAALNDYAAEKWLDLSPDDRVEIEATPDYLEELISEGMVESFDALAGNPRERCYLTRSKNESYLTLLNVLVHEFAHAFHHLLTYRWSGHVLLKISSSIKAPVMEGVGFHREWELYEEALGLLRQTNLKPEEERLLELFGPTRARQAARIEEFEFETRVWRVARFLRVLCDVEVHLGLRTYSGFLEWANGRTGFAKRLIHQYCFSFMSSPGEADCYAIPGMTLAGMQEEAMRRGHSRKEFNTRVASMGFYPWAIVERRLRGEFCLT
jgi:hypothetical protein